MPVIKLSQGTVDSLRCVVKGKTDYFDSQISGLLLQVRSSGRKTYYYRERDETGKVNQIRLGDAEEIRFAMIKALVEERKKQRVEQRLSRVRQAWGLHNNDSCTKTVRKETSVPAENEITAEKEDISPTLADFIDDAYLPFIKTYKRSYSSDLSLINNHVKPFFGEHRLAQLSKADLIAFISERRETHKPGTINRVLVLLRYIYNLALKWETQGLSKNPISGTPLLEENNKRERYLSSAEVDRLVYCVRHSRNEMLQYIVPGLILTGARKQELLRARWEDMNRETKIWRIPMSKSGKARHVPMSDALLLLLETIPQRCEWVFANPKTLKPFVSFFYSWDTARRQAGLPEVRVHDLRHSFASFLVNNGRSLYEVQRILGHTQIKTTQRYAHLDQQSLLSAANEVSRAAPNLLGEGTRPEFTAVQKRPPRIRADRVFNKRAEADNDDDYAQALVARAERLRRGGME